ncbi:saccharopine dehydrogenase family protein [Actinokineospora cianjurensis]|uniref:Saccharopine dehydrogenase (NAD+, L-glutamate forming) n=1 Tax=Actinokineospora cianjurensis TaxID=585224 RepID=A0A421B9X9_9PSEU|nr:saccharopine dehydrogenase NADP-binding domain-containing protein [Actinokineospora cianjurensis]RLK60943.1 saccharopine dehydrogenase (NAD+, L-glutamate forming) [Actinokineospora cianjurensis]
MPTGRRFDVVLFGATGFTGGLTAEYLAEHAPPGLRWALAGRNPAKLAAVRDRLGIDDLELLTADVNDPASLTAIAEATRVVITTVGPYITYGDPLVGACAAAGTDYVDLTGEPEFVDRTYLRHHAKAVETGARLVHCCGFDSIPYDLGVLYTVNQLPADVPLTVDGYITVSASVSGGTFQSAVNAFSRLRDMQKAAAERRKVEPRSVRRVRGRARAGKVADLGIWAVPLPTIDPQVVLRSARALEQYGPEFTYGHHLAVKRLPTALAVAGGAAGLIAASQVRPLRTWLLNRKPPGDGPTPAERQRSWFKATFIGTGADTRVHTEITGGDPGYDETAKMLAESALCLATDDLPPTAGQVTTATAMGEALTTRLTAAGITFRTVSKAVRT